MANDQGFKPITIDDVLLSNERESRSILDRAMTENPDDYGKTLRLSREFKTTPQIVNVDRPTLERQQKLNSVNMVDLAIDAPVVAGSLANYDRAALLQDIITPAKFLENTVKTLRTVTDVIPEPEFTSMVSSKYQRGEDVVDVAHLGHRLMMGEQLSQEELIKLSDFYRKPPTEVEGDFGPFEKWIGLAAENLPLTIETAIAGAKEAPDWAFRGSLAGAAIGGIPTGGTGAVPGAIGGGR